MRYFRATPVLLDQSHSELKVSYCCLLATMEEVRHCASVLQTMSGFSGELQSLKRIRTQCDRHGQDLTSEYQTLQTVAKLYRNCEQKNRQMLDGPVLAGQKRASREGLKVLNELRISSGMTESLCSESVHVQQMVDPDVIQAVLGG